MTEEQARELAATLRGLRERLDEFRADDPSNLAALTDAERVELRKELGLLSEAGFEFEMRMVKGSMVERDHEIERLREQIRQLGGDPEDAR